MDPKLRRQVNNPSSKADSPISFAEYMLLCSCDMGSAEIKGMISKAKREYVNERHTRAISQMNNATGYKKGKWKTYIDNQGKRKEVIKATEAELYAALFEHYYALDNQAKTLKDVFLQLVEYKQDCLGRTQSTIENDERRFSYLSSALQNMAIAEISDEDIQKWLTKQFMPTHPKEAALRKMFQLLGQIFDYGIRKRCCFDNPMKYLTARDYVKDCDLKKKPNEKREFSEAELARLKAYGLANKSNPRALMMLMAMETGMRIGELTAVHASDISDEYIHVHRQQRMEKDADGHLHYYEVGHTKDERMHPHDGRYVPITEDCRKAIELAKCLPGESEYLFHNKDGKMITTDSYAQFLNRTCKRLGTLPTNNHAFRIAFNSRLIELDFSPSDRALILGHEVQTNENHYSITDKRRLESIKDRIRNNGKENDEKPVENADREPFPALCEGVPKRIRTSDPMLRRISFTRETAKGGAFPVSHFFVTHIVTQLVHKPRIFFN